MTMKKLLTLAMIVLMVLSTALVSALDASNLRFDTVRVNGDYVNVVGNQTPEVLAVEEGQTIEVRLGLVAANGAKDVEVEAKISGFEYSDKESLVDSTPLFDIAAGTTKYVTLNVKVPRQLDEDNYWLRVRVLDKNTPALELTVPLAVEPVRHGLGIADVSFSPGLSVKAGRSLLTTVLLENFGRKDQNDVKVTVSLPQLGVSATEYVDMDASPDKVDFEDVPEMFLAVPATAAPGDYEVKVTAEFDQYESVSKSFTLTVLASDLFPVPGFPSVPGAPAVEKLVMAVGPESQNLAAGKMVTYAVALSNAGSTSRAYTVEAVTGDWATAKVSDSLVVLDAGKSKVVYVDVTAGKDAAPGEHMVSLTVKAGDEALETVTLSANVVGGTAPGGAVGLRNGLEIALIILVVLLVIIGLIIGFSRMHKDNGEGDKTYY
jgi:uncharacterized membrane protein